MITDFVRRWYERKEEVREKFKNGRPYSYIDIVRAVVSILEDENEYASPDPDRITVINHGDYQGTLLFIIGANNYQPDTFWYVKIAYGSCSGCDTLARIQESSYDDTSERTINDYMTLALHVVQQMKKLGD